MRSSMGSPTARTGPRWSDPETLLADLDPVATAIVRLSGGLGSYGLPR
jgi:hypothetical protein